MKKNILKATFVAAFALFAGYNVYNSQKATDMSDLALANAEALAGCSEVSYDSGMQQLVALNGCHCISCCEPAATNCNCRSI